MTVRESFSLMPGIVKGRAGVRAAREVGMPVDYPLRRAVSRND